MNTSAPIVDLSNCAREPIHLSGAIQPHGALLAFTPEGSLASRSKGAEALWGALPAIGGKIADTHMSAELRAHIAACLDLPPRSDSMEVTTADERVADLGVHFHDGLMFAELEPRGANAPPPSKFAIVAQRALERIQAQSDLDSLLRVGVDEIARLSGFDRVMAYRFLDDDSGEIVAERMAKPMESYLGMRYPESDIPAQARALFVKNPVRLIPDVVYRPVPIEPELNPLTGQPIDLSYAALRSVSPIHVEYLTNMGIRASMAVSIVIGDRLWGMFACHHYSPLLVSPAVRLTCRLLSQVASVAVQRFVATQHADHISRARQLCAAIADRAKSDEYMIRALTNDAPSVTDLVRCAGAAVTSVSQVSTIGAAPSREHIAAIVDWLNTRPDAMRFTTHQVAADAPAIAAACEGFAGFAAIRFSAEPNSFVLWFRREQLATLRWAGDPQKAVTLGAHGERLSPRGSFAEWKEIVRGRSEPWTADEIAALEDLRRELADISAARVQETVRTREILLAMLGHDLRNPLNAISMAGQVLKLDHSRVGQVQEQIVRISGRMGRLINHVLDMSRLQAGVGLVRDRQSQDLAALLRDVIAESRSSHPDVQIEERYAEVGRANIDADRIMQVVGNLISNARHHGVKNTPVIVEGERRDGSVLVRVINQGPAITGGALETLFEPFKRGSLDNPNNPRGLGLGLYIASMIIREHGGELGVDSRDGLVIFTIALPG